VNDEFGGNTFLQKSAAEGEDSPDCRQPAHPSLSLTALGPQSITGVTAHARAEKKVGRAREGSRHQREKRWERIGGWNQGGASPKGGVPGVREDKNINHVGLALKQTFAKRIFSVGPTGSFLLGEEP